MDNKVFERPVPVFVGIGFVTTVLTVMDAYMVLNDWTSSRNCPEHEAALKSCRMALAGETDTDTVRDLFTTFARRNHILAEEDVMVLVDQDVMADAA